MSMYFCKACKRIRDTDRHASSILMNGDRVCDDCIPAVPKEIEGDPVENANYYISSTKVIQR